MAHLHPTSCDRCGCVKPLYYLVDDDDELSEEQLCKLCWIKRGVKV